MFKDSRITGVRELETAVLLGNSERPHSDSPELGDHVVAYCFFGVDSRRIDYSVAMQLVEIRGQPLDDGSLFRISLAEWIRVRKKEIIVHDAGKNAACERRSAFSQDFRSSRRSHRQ